MKLAHHLRLLLVAGLVLASGSALAQSGSVDDTRGGENIFSDDPLIVAVYENRVERVHALIVRQHPHSRTDGDGRTALIWGAIQGSYDALKLVLEAKARPDLVDKVGNGALYHAAENGHLEVVNLLLSYNAPVDQENRDGRTPLMAAVRNGHAQIVKALIAAGADLSHSDFTGRTALDIARNGRSRQVTKLLEAAGAR
jgi:ankyrin repeat protein